MTAEDYALQKQREAGSDYDLYLDTDELIEDYKLIMSMKDE